MNILLFSRAAWDDTNSVGNTFSNFFEGWDQDRFCHFYVRKQLPHNSCVSLYYNISVVDVVKSLFGKKRQSPRFTAEDLLLREATITQAHKKEQASIDRIHKQKNPLIYWATDQIWRSRVWQNEEFQQFVTEVDPDIFFSFATNSFILWPLIQYMKDHTQAKIVLFIADDIQNSIERQVFYRKGYLRRTYRKCIENADVVYGISPAMCESYSVIFGREIKLLMKGCEFSKDVTTEVNHPLRIVYAGNLLYGREKTLGQIAEILEELNRDRIQAKLEIYTGTTITPELEHLLNREHASRIMGRRSYEEIKDIMNQADLVLHVESFEPEQKEYIRYSLSTKIIDCLQCGSGVLGIGLAGISSIEYLRGVEGVRIVDDLADLKGMLEKLLSEPEQIPSDAAKIRAYALEHHDIHQVKRKLRDDFLYLHK